MVDVAAFAAVRQGRGESNNNGYLFVVRVHSPWLAADRN